MPTKNKSTALYPHPFSKAYWRDAAAELKDTKMLVFAALMIALRVALKLVYIPLAPNLRINTAFLANALGAMVFGPVVAVPAAVISDFLGWLIHPEGPYFPPMVLLEVGGSLIFALFLYRAKITPVRVMLSRFCICLFINILLNTPLMMLYYAICMGGKLYILTVPHILKNLFMFPIESVVLTLFLSALLTVTSRAELTYGTHDVREALRFTKKQIGALVLLFVIGTGFVAGYLTYYYNTTSLSASYSDSERYEKNTGMTEVVKENAPELREDTLVTTVESAYKKFLGKEVTYTVAVYEVDEAALAGYDKDLETIRGLSKSKAKSVSQDGVMTLLGTATVVRNDSTGEVVSFTMQ